MIDNEIIKALECCSRNRCLTGDCPFAGNSFCMTLLTTYSLDLINRQQAEIKKLKNDCFCIANERDAIKDCLNEAVTEAKTEARKEFAKFLIDKSENGVIYISDLPDFVKEMG